MLLLPLLGLPWGPVLAFLQLLVVLTLVHELLHEGTHGQDIESSWDGLLDGLVIHDETAGTSDEFVLVILVAEPNNFLVVPT